MFHRFNKLLLSALVGLGTAAAPAHAVSLADLLRGAAGKTQQAPRPANQFGATVSNPGSVMPEWWNEDHYVPETIEGAQRLRIGSAGANGRSTVLGRETCDLVLLYHAKSGQQISAPELEECALTEYHLARGVTGEQVNLGDVFAKQEVIARFSKLVLERMARLKNVDLFYSRAFAFKLQPYNLAANHLELSANLTSNSTRRFTYSLGGARFPQSDSWFMGHLAGFAPEDARALESARAGYRVHASQNLFVYKVIGTREVNRRRVVDVDLVKFEFQYTDEKNSLRTISF
jgi:hypothetical protein